MYMSSWNFWLLGDGQARASQQCTFSTSLHHTHTHKTHHGNIFTYPLSASPISLRAKLEKVYFTNTNFQSFFWGWKREITKSAASYFGHQLLAKGPALYLIHTVIYHSTYPDGCMLYIRTNYEIVPTISYYYNVRVINLKTSNWLSFLQLNY